MSRARDLSNFLVQDSRLSNIDSDYVQLRQATADLTNLNASNLTSGTIPNARVSSGSVTQHVSAVTTAEGTYTVSYGNFAATTQSSYYVRVGDMCHVTVYFYRTGYTNTENLSYMSLPLTSVNSGHIVGGGSFAVRDGYEKGLYTFVYKNDNKMYFRSQYGTQAWDHPSGSATFRGSDWQTHGDRYVICHCTYAVA